MDLLSAWRREARPLEAGKSGRPGSNLWREGVDADLEVLADHRGRPSKRRYRFHGQDGHLGLFNALLNALAIPEALARQAKARLLAAFRLCAGACDPLPGKAEPAAVRPSRRAGRNAPSRSSGCERHSVHRTYGVQTRSRGAFRRRRPTRVSPPFRRRRSSSSRDYLRTHGEADATLDAIEALMARAGSAWAAR